MQDEPRNPDTDSLEDPYGNALEDHLNVINFIQQNAVIVTGRKVKGSQPEQDKSDSERWL